MFPMVGSPTSSDPGILIVGVTGVVFVITMGVVIVCLVCVRIRDRLRKAQAGNQGTVQHNVRTESIDLARVNDRLQHIVS